MNGTENTGKFHKNAGIFFLILHMTAVCIYILVFRPGNMQDTSYWVYRIGALADEMRIKGVLNALPPRILSVTFEGYGYGAPLYYCDMFLWIPAVFVLLGMSEFTSFTILCTAIWTARAFVAGYSANLVLKQFEEVTNRYGLSALFAFAYSCFPYMMEVLLVRGAIGESLAGIFFPLITALLYTITHAVKKNCGHMILLALGFWGVVCSHTISIVITACCVVIYMLGNWKLFWRDKWKLVEVFKAGMLA